MNLTNNEWYNYLIEDLKAIITERVYNSRIELITGYAEVGERIYNDQNYIKYAKGNREFLDRLFKDIDISQSTGYKCLQFYEKFVSPYKQVQEAIKNLPENKAISWTKICNKYLLKNNGKINENSCEHEKFMCIKCHKIFTKEEVLNDTKRNHQKLSDR